MPLKVIFLHIFNRLNFIQFAFIKQVPANPLALSYIWLCE
jgi:hypothetical protein